MSIRPPRYSRLAVLLRGTSSPLAARTLASVAGAADRLHESARNLTEAERALAEYIAHITGGPVPSVDASAVTPIPHAPASPAPISGFDPAKAAEIRPLVSREKTIGRLYRSDGAPVGSSLRRRYRGTGEAVQQ